MTGRGTGRGGLVEAISAVLLDVWGGLSVGRLGCAARQDVSVPGCWPGQAFTPETGRPAGAGAGVGADTSCRAARPSLQRHPISLRPADPARSGRHRGGPHRGLLRRGGVRAGGGWDRFRAAGPGTPSGVLGQVVPCPRSPVPARGRGGSRGRPGPETGRGGRGLRQDVVAGARDRTWWEGLGQDVVGGAGTGRGGRAGGSGTGRGGRAWDRTWWEGLGQDVVGGPGTGRGGRGPSRTWWPGPGTGRGGRGPGIACLGPPQAVSGHRIRVRPPTRTRQAGHQPHNEQETRYFLSPPTSRRPAISCLHPRAGVPTGMADPCTRRPGNPRPAHDRVGGHSLGSAGAHSGRQLSCRSSAWCST